MSKLYINTNELNKSVVEKIHNASLNLNSAVQKIDSMVIPDVSVKSGITEAIDVIKKVNATITITSKWLNGSIKDFSSLDNMSFEDVKLLEEANIKSRGVIIR